MSIHPALAFAIALTLCVLALGVVFYARVSADASNVIKEFERSLINHSVVRRTIGLAYNMEQPVKRLEVLYLQEVCYNLALDNRLDGQQEAVASIMNALAESQQWDAMDVAIGDYCDKPVQPLGQPSVDHCFILHQQITPWTSLVGQPYRTSTSMFNMNSGVDVKGNQLDAIISGFYTSGLQRTGGDNNSVQAVAGRTPGYLRRPMHNPDDKIDKLILIVTGNPYHVAGDHAIGLPYPKGGLGSFTERKCIMHDYPSVDDLTDVLLKEDVHVAFLVMDHLTLVPETADLYVELVEKLDYAGCPTSLVHIAHSNEEMVGIAPKIGKLLDKTNK